MTTSFPLSVSLAAIRKTVLLVSTDPAHNLSHTFAQKFSRTSTKVRGFDKLDAMEVEPSASLDLPNAQALPVSGINANVVEALGEEQAAKALMSEIGNAIPGIDEVMAFATVMKSVHDYA